MPDSSRAYLKALQNKLEDYFSQDEFRILCLDVGVAYDSLEGGSKPGRVRSLLLHLAREQRLQDLIELAREERPHVAWHSVPSDFQLPESAASEGSGGVTHIYHGPVEINQGETTQFIGNFQGANLTIKSQLENVQQTINNSPTADTGTRQTLHQLLLDINIVLQAVPAEKRAAAEEVATATQMLVEQATAVPRNELMLKMVGSGLLQSAIGLEPNAPGLVDLMTRFTTAVTTPPG